MSYSLIGIISRSGLMGGIGVEESASTCGVLEEKICLCFFSNQEFISFFFFQYLTVGRGLGVGCIILRLSGDRTVTVSSPSM